MKRGKKMQKEENGIENKKVDSIAGIVAKYYWCPKNAKSFLVH